jgi:hypothetical protein
MRIKEFSLFNKDGNKGKRWNFSMHHQEKKKKEKNANKEKRQKKEAESIFSLFLLNTGVGAVACPTFKDRLSRAGKD